MTRRQTALAAAAAAATALTGLTGCASIQDTLEGVHSESFSTRTEAASGWVGVPMPAWLPEDAVDIRTTATVDETNAVIAFTGSEPSGCTNGARASLPFDGRYGGFEDASELPDEVLRCGSYEVHATDAGWLAWFTATEAGQTPAP
jgi:hypothetical protein